MQIKVLSETGKIMKEVRPNATKRWTVQVAVK